MYRKVVWYLRGRKTYTKGGYEKAAKSFNSGDLEHNLAGKSYIVTGANSGIGYSTAEFLASKGAQVHMVCRSKDRGQKARDEIASASSNDDVLLHVVDMADCQGIKAFAEEFASTYALDALVNNAGCMLHERTLNKEGLEKNFAVNTFGTYLLTELLLPTLRKSTTPRVVMVSSGGMLLENLELDDLQFEKGKFTGEAAYARHKRQQVVMAEEWAKTYPQIGFYTMHPGWADTPAVRTALPDFYEKMKDSLRTPFQGADTAIWLCVVPTIPSEWNGAFLQDRQPVSKHLPLACTHSTPAQQEKLMTALRDIATKNNLITV